MLAIDDFHGPSSTVVATDPSGFVRNTQSNHKQPQESGSMFLLRNMPLLRTQLLAGRQRPRGQVELSFGKFLGLGSCRSRCSYQPQDERCKVQVDCREAALYCSEARTKRNERKPLEAQIQKHNLSVSVHVPAADHMHGLNGSQMCPDSIDPISQDILPINSLCHG